MMTLCFKDSREEDFQNNTWWSLSCQFSSSLQQYCCWSIHSKSLSVFEAVYHSLSQMSTLSDSETCVIWSFAINSWISDFISHCHHWFHSWTFKNQFRFRCSDNNHLQVLQEDEIHLWQKNLNSCWMSKSLFHSHHWLKHFNCMNWR